MQHFNSIIFRIWNSSAGIPSPLLALFVMMLPKAHLTSHFRTSGSRWVITPSLLSGSWRSLLYSSSVYSCHLFLISSSSVWSIPSLSFIVPIFAWNVPLVSLIFFKRSLVFPILLSCIHHSELPHCPAVCTTWMFLLHGCTEPQTAQLSAVPHWHLNNCTIILWDVLFVALWGLEPD